ncbi:hypothetical protein ABL849_00030 [Variovorax sp. 375MFSha3.1]|uniref:hypothetical protein n=1 Tax=unclassified Variovorax TaxID=663243 RepID=UPI0034E84458
MSLSRLVRAVLNGDKGGGQALSKPEKERQHARESWRAGCRKIDVNELRLFTPDHASARG